MAHMRACPRAHVPPAQPRVMRSIFAAAYESKTLYGQGFAWMASWVSDTILLNSDATVNSSAVNGAEGTLVRPAPRDPTLAPRWPHVAPRDPT
eukprot:3369799-Prymnesium_polylepis.1